MSAQRNPFRLLASENIQSESTFLRLFGPGVLDLVSENTLWEKVNIFQSAPGGGKTTLFRLFTPLSLLTLYNNRANEEYKVLFNHLNRLNVISEEGPKLLGLLLSCNRDYHSIEDMNINNNQKTRLFLSLLNSRIIITLLRDVLLLNGYEYPDDLDKVDILKPSKFQFPPNVPIPCTGLELFKWATQIEMSIIYSMDNFVPLQASNLIGHGTLFSLQLLNPSYIHINNQFLSHKILLMIDDLHKLRSLQREKILDVILTLRLPLGIWIAERLEALNPKELLSLGVRRNREYYSPILLEDYWRSGGKSSKFEKILLEIANRRSRIARDFPITDFDTCLESYLDGPELHDTFLQIFEDVSERVKRKMSPNTIFEKWMEEINNMNGTTREKAIACLSLEILLHRKPQQITLFDESIKVEDSFFPIESNIKAASEIFLHNQYDIPYYFGFSCLVKLASSNIEQFLILAGDLYEEYISELWLGKSNRLTPQRQQEILLKASNDFLENIRNSIPNVIDVFNFIESLGKLCKTQSFRPSAPYSPGVTGIGISMAELERLKNVSENTKLSRLRDAIAQCMSNNLLEAYPYRRQGKKGKRWLILYLNRILCVYFGLPLNYGGWRSKRLAEIISWIG